MKIKETRTRNTQVEDMWRQNFCPIPMNNPLPHKIWPDRISIFLFGDDPQIIEIKSEKITKGFRNYFDVLYKIAKP